jgi:hypothetical protein
MTRTNSIMLLAAVALSLGIVSPKLTPLDTQPPLSKSDIVIAADEDAASTPAATGTQDSAKVTKAPDSQNNSGQTTNTQAKSDKMTAEPSTPK